jgi:hypothetical protein
MKFAQLLATVIIASSAFAGTLKDGIFYVDGKPFYPLGAWQSSDITSDEIVAMGMNCTHRNVRGNAWSHAFMRDHKAHGVQVIPYLSSSYKPRSEKTMVRIAELAKHGNVLAWCVGDDLYKDKLPGIKGEVPILRREAPGIPTVGDFWEKEPDLVRQFEEHIDITSLYDYPLPEKTFDQFRGFFAEQRARFGDPIWTYIQNFQWKGDGFRLNIGMADGSGPIPDPEQVRLMAYVALNSGVRGMVFFSDRQLLRLPELGAEVGLFCHEATLVNEQIAGGTMSKQLPASDPDIDAITFTYKDEVVISAALTRKNYHRWMDSAVVRDLTIRVPWKSRRIPKAALIDMPDVRMCGVKRIAGDSLLVTIPRMEIAGFIVLSTDDERIAELRAGVTSRSRELAPLAVIGLASQNRKITAALYQSGIDHLYKFRTPMAKATRAARTISNALAKGNTDKVIRDWRHAMRVGRISIDTLMDFAFAREEAISPSMRKYLESPYSLTNIQSLANAPLPGSPWKPVRDFLITGPFPLEADGDYPWENPAPGFARVYPPETDSLTGTVFKTMDGLAGWKNVSTSITGRMNLLPHFETHNNVVVYARCTVTAPRDTTIRMKWCSNDGARLWINGKLRFDEHMGRRINLKTLKPITVTLKKGKNVFLAKIENFGRNWGAYLAFEDPKRELIYTAR